MYESPSDDTIKEVNIGLEEAEIVINRLRLKAA
jgi:hypothetical protein